MVNQLRNLVCYYSQEITFPEVGLAYAIIDLGVGVVTGKTITDRIGDGVDNVVYINEYK